MPVDPNQGQLFASNNKGVPGVYIGDTPPSNAQEGGVWINPPYKRRLSQEDRNDIVNVYRWSSFDNKKVVAINEMTPISMEERHRIYVTVEVVGPGGERATHQDLLTEEELQLVGKHAMEAAAWVAKRPDPAPVTEWCCMWCGTNLPAREELEAHEEACAS